MNDLMALERLAGELLRDQGLRPNELFDGLPRSAALARSLAEGLEDLGIDWKCEEEDMLY